MLNTYVLLSSQHPKTMSFLRVEVVLPCHCWSPSLITLPGKQQVYNNFWLNEWKCISYFLVPLTPSLTGLWSSCCRDQHYRGLWATSHTHKGYASPAVHTSWFLPWGFPLDTEVEAPCKLYPACATRKCGRVNTSWTITLTSGRQESMNKFFYLSFLQWTIQIQNLFGFLDDSHDGPMGSNH